MKKMHSKTLKFMQGYFKFKTVPSQIEASVKRQSH